MKGVASFRGAPRWRVCMSDESRSVVDELLVQWIASIRRGPIIVGDEHYAWRIEDAVLYRGRSQTAHFDLKDGNLDLHTSSSPTFEDNGLSVRGPTVKGGAGLQNVLVDTLAH